MKTQDTFTESWLTLQPKLERFIYSKVKSEAETHDILQEVFIKAYTHFDSLKDIEKIPQWVFSITRNEVNAFFNTQKKTQQFLPDVSVEENHLNEHFEDCITGFVDSLPPKYSKAVRLSDIENISQKEVAKKLDISYSGAKSRVQRGREKLKTLMEQCCTIQHDNYGNIIDYEPKKGGHCYKYC